MTLSPAQRERASLAALVLANVAPVVGVLFFGWSAFLVLLVYWFENVVIGVLNLFRMALCRGPKSPWPAKLFMIPFFTVHYGMFTWGHGVFVFGFFGPEHGDAFEASPLPALLEFLTRENLLLAVAALAASHLLSFLVNYLAGGEYRRASLAALMAAPYGRVVVLHVTVLVGGLAVQALGSPLWALLLLVALKTGMDVAAHRRSHRKLAEGGAKGGEEHGASASDGARPKTRRPSAGRARRKR